MLNRMLHNRKLEVRLTREEPKQLPVGSISAVPQPPVEEVVSDITDSIVSGTVTIMGTYMLADTIRKIVIHAFTK